MKNSIDFLLTPLNATSAQAFFQLIQNNKDRLAHSFPGTLSQNLTFEDTKQYYKTCQQKVLSKSYFPYLVMVKESGDYIGFVDFKNISWKIPKAEIGYFIDSRYEGMGITSKVVTRFIEMMNKKYAFKKIASRIYPGNIGSAKVAEKNGFELEGTIRNDHITMDGELVDILYYGKVF